MFSKTCKRLYIEDLHLHDMRHESISRLFEKELNIADVSQISLHQSWTSLKIYTNLKPEETEPKLYRECLSSTHSGHRINYFYLE